MLNRYADLLFFTSDEGGASGAAGGGGETPPPEAAAAAAGGETPPENNAGTPPTPVEPSPTEAAVAAARRADATAFAATAGLTGEFATIDDVKTALQERAEATQAEQAEQAVKAKFDTARETLKSQLAAKRWNTYNANTGMTQEVGYTADEIAALDKVFEDAHVGVQTEAELRAYNLMGVAAAAVLPADLHDAFNAAYEAGGTFQDFLHTLAETYAPRAQSIAKMEPAKLVETIPTLKTYVDAQIAKALSDGFDLARDGKSLGTPRAGGDGASNNETSDGKTAAQLAKDINAGRVDVRAELARLQAG